MSTLQTIGLLGFVVLLALPLLLVVYTMLSMVIEDHRKGNHELLILTGFAVAFVGLLLMFAFMARGDFG